MEWIVVLWVSRGLTSFEVDSLEACLKIQENMRGRTTSQALCVSNKTGEVIQ